MKLEQQVTSLEISKRLKEFGVRKESLFYWYKDNIDINEFEMRLGILYFDELDEAKLGGYDYNLDCVHGNNDFKPDEYVSSFTVAELGEMLPRYIIYHERSCELEIIRSSVWRFRYDRDIFLTAGNDDTEADARGKMLIYLLENKLITF